MSTTVSSRRRWRLFLVLVVEGAVLWVLLTLGSVLGAVQWGAVGRWLSETDPTQILTALLRLALVALMLWFLATTVLYGLTGGGGDSPGLGGRRLSGVTPSFVRRLIDGAAAVSVVVSAVTSAASAASAAVAGSGNLGPAMTASAQPAARAAGIPDLGGQSTGRSRRTGQKTSDPQDGQRFAPSSRPPGRHLPHPGLTAHNALLAETGGFGVSADRPDGLAAGTKFYVVQPGDCLSVIAERHLGDWRRDSDIDRLNRGRPQTDGRTLVDDHWIYPGWVLVMPEDSIDVLVVGPELKVNREPSLSRPGSPVPSAKADTPGDLGSVASSRTGEASSSSPEHSADARPVQAGIGLLVAAAFALAVHRRRREAMHARRSGWQIRRSRRVVEEAELLARAKAGDADDLVRRVDWALRILGRELAEGGGQSSPSVALVRAGLGGIEVMVDPPSVLAPRHFEAVEGGSIWVLNPSLSDQELEDLAEPSWPFLPALVTAGETALGTVLVNLEHAGVLRLGGDQQAVKAALDEVALELRCQPWAVEALGHLILDEATVGPAGESGHQSDGSAEPAGETADSCESWLGLSVRSAEVAIRTSGRCAEGLDGASTAAIQRAASFQWLPTAVVCGAEADRDLVRTLCDAAQPDRSALVVVTAGPEEGNGWQLRLDSEGGAVLRGALDGQTFTLPLERRTDPDLAARLDEALTRPLGQSLPARWDEQVDELPELVGTVDLPELDSWIAEVEGEWEVDEVTGDDGAEGETQVLAFRSQEQRGPSVTIDLLDQSAPDPVSRVSPGGEGELPLPFPTPGAPVQLTILGPVGLTGSADLASVPSSRRASALAVIAFLATRDRPVAADEIAAALWPTDSAKDHFGEPRRKTVMNVISRARSLLGEPLEGPSRLLLTGRGYVLSAEVDCDWNRFHRLVDTESGDPAAEVAVLRSALELVSGPPLAGSLSGPFFEWVSAQHLDLVIEARVVDTAERLGVLALDLGDTGTAEWAVRKGLDLDPAREELYRVWMHVAGRSGRPDQVDEIYRRLCRALQRHLDAGMAPGEESEAVRSAYSGRAVRI